MGVQLQAVGEATETMHGVARQALALARAGQQRVAEAEAKNERVRAELKEQGDGDAAQARRGGA